MGRNGKGKKNWKATKITAGYSKNTNHQTKTFNCTLPSLLRNFAVFRKMFQKLWLKTIPFNDNDFSHNILKFINQVFILYNSMVIIMDEEYTWILWQGKNCRKFSLPTWNSFIGQFVHSLGGGEDDVKVVEGGRGLIVN